MAMAEKKSLFVHGENGGQVITTGNADHRPGTRPGRGAALSL